MIRSLAVFVFAALAGATPALAAYPSTYAIQGGRGIADTRGTVRFVASADGRDTLLRAVRNGTTLRSTTVRGAFGVPTLITHNLALGMFRDGSAFVLQSVGTGPTTSFAVVRTSDLAVREAITLRGAYAFDALSPDGSMLYLVRHRSADDFQHYVVRAFDLRRHVLRPGRVADKTQQGWVMQGYPSARIETPDGRWVYTLYVDDGGYPFVHALDTVRAVAHCVGFAWSGDQGPLYGYSLAVRGSKLLVLRNDRSVYRVIDRRTWAVRAR